MKDLYDEAKDPHIEWLPRSIQEELYYTLSRIVLVQDVEGKVQAFSMFRFETFMEKCIYHGTCIRELSFSMYVYQMQVAEGLRGTGICRRMFTALESLAQRYHAEFTMLTCFQCNTRALAVYEHLDYEEHEDTNNTAKVFIKRFNYVKKTRREDREWTVNIGY